MDIVAPVAMAAGRLFELALGFREIALLSAADTTRLGHDSAGGEA